MPGATSSCKLCHGPLFESIPTPMSPAMQSTASRQLQPIPEVVDCHANCVEFACPGCMAKDRSSYQILNLKNHIYDYHCGQCMAEVPVSQGSSTSGPAAVQCATAAVAAMQPSTSRQAIY